MGDAAFKPPAKKPTARPAATTTSDPKPNRMPDAKGTRETTITTLQRQLDLGDQAVQQLRTTVVPSLERLVNGDDPGLAMPFVKASALLSKIDDVLARTNVASSERRFIVGVLQIPEDLVFQRNWLRASYHDLKANVEALIEAFQARHRPAVVSEPPRVVPKPPPVVAKAPGVVPTAAPASDRKVSQAERAEKELENFDRAHPAFFNSALNGKLRDVDTAMALLAREQENGISVAHDEIIKYVKAKPPPADKNVLHELAMFALDIASAGVAGAVAKTLERGLKGLSATLAKQSARTAAKSVSVHLDDSVVAAITDSVKEALKSGSKRARSTAPKVTERHPDLSADPRIGFIEAARSQNNLDVSKRSHGITHMAALLRPTAYRSPDLAVAALEQLQLALELEAQQASKLYAESTIRRWIGFISELQISMNRVGSVEGGGIRPAAGVVDIGFQAGATPRHPVTARTAIIRGISNAAASRFASIPLLGVDVPIRLYGVPSPLHAELLVTVTRSPNGAVEFLDQTNGAAPGPATWLKQRGKGDTRAGAEQLLTDLLSRSLVDQGVELTTDQDPTLEGG